jgi:hypothetical protein
MSLIPIIQIDSGEARKLDVSIDLQKIYYQPSGYQRTVKKLYEASKKVGFDFSLDEVRDWLERQAVHQIHMPRPRYIPRASFCSITTPNEVHQADVLYMPYDKIGRITYLFCLNIVDVASRYKVSVPIGAYSVRDRQGILTSKTIARALKEKYDDPDCSLFWPKLLITDKGSEFKGDCEILLEEHGTRFQKAESKHTMGIVERYNRTLIERLFRSQDASDQLDLTERSRVWVKNLPIIVEDLNNSITRLIGMSPANAIEMEEVIAKSSKSRNGPMGYDEKTLPSDALVRYLLLNNDLEDGRRRAGDLNWSSQIYHIRESLVQKNQPVLYWLIDDEGHGPKRSFVREELMIIPYDTELPPQWILSN